MAGGRPSKYSPECPEKARTLFEQGCTNREVAEFFRVDESTLRNWAADYPEFFLALKLGKAAADDRVEQSLYRRAVGYEHDAVKILMTKEGDVYREAYIERYPPDTVAGIFWLKNRRPEQWRDVKAVEHSGAVTHRHVHELSDEALLAIATGSSTGAVVEANGAPDGSTVQ